MWLAAQRTAMVEGGIPGRTMRSSGVTVICAQGTYAMLLLGSDTALVRQAGTRLNAI